MAERISHFWAKLVAAVVTAFIAFTVTFCGLLVLGVLLLMGLFTWKYGSAFGALGSGLGDGYVFVIVGSAPFWVPLFLVVGSLVGMLTYSTIARRYV